MTNMMNKIVTNYRNKCNNYKNITPEQAETIQLWLEEWLKENFSYKYWRMPKEVKNAHYACCAAQLLLLIDSKLEVDKGE